MRWSNVGLDSMLHLTDEDGHPLDNEDESGRRLREYCGSIFQDIDGLCCRLSQRQSLLDPLRARENRIASIYLPLPAKYFKTTAPRTWDSREQLGDTS